MGYSKENLKIHTAGHVYSLPVLSTPLPSPLYLPFMYFSFSLKSRSPLFQLGVLGERCKLSGPGVWGGAAVEIDFWRILGLNLTSGGNNF